MRFLGNYKGMRMHIFVSLKLYREAQLETNSFHGNHRVFFDGSTVLAIVHTCYDP